MALDHSLLVTASNLYANTAVKQADDAAPVSSAHDSTAEKIRDVAAAPAAIFAGLLPMLGAGAGVMYGGLGGAGLGGLAGGAYGAYNPGAYSTLDARGNPEVKRRSRLMGALRGIAAGGGIGGVGGAVIGGPVGLAAGVHGSRKLLRDLNKPLD